MASNISSHRDLEAWKKSMDLVEMIYKITKNLPSEEKFGLFSQMRRSAVSIPSNIAEGYRRHSRADYARFVAISFGSGAELETQLELIVRLCFVRKSEVEPIEQSLQEVMKILNGLYSSLNR